MTPTQRDHLNNFFVKTFNAILLLEERSLAERGLKNLSVKEIHVISSVVRLAPLGQNTMSRIAEDLCISVSALTTAVNTLVQKGYLKRAAHEKDRRIVLVFPTPDGENADRIHSDFHAKMLDGVEQIISDDALQTLVSSLDQLTSFFGSLSKI